MPIATMLPSESAALRRQGSEELSGSSTHSVNSFLRPKAAPEHSAGQRRVQFNEEANTVHEALHMEKEDAPDRWYQRVDYKTFRENYLSETREIIRVELENKKHKDSYINAMDDVFEACCTLQLTDRDIEALRRVVRVDRVGLERMTVRSIRMDKKMRQSEIVEAVLEVQRDLRLAPETERCEMIATVVEELSHPSCLFATILAQACIAL